MYLYLKHGLHVNTVQWRDKKQNRKHPHNNIENALNQAKLYSN